MRVCLRLYEGDLVFYAVFLQYYYMETGINKSLGMWHDTQLL